MIKDLIYIDIEKLASIWGQIEGGQHAQLESAGEARAERNRRIRRGDLEGTPPHGGGAQLRDMIDVERSILDIKLLHHDLLNQVESDLATLGLVADLNSLVAPDETDPANVRAALGSSGFLRADGWATIEDYQRILSIADHFNMIIDFIGKAEIQSVRNTAQYQELQRAMEDAKAAISTQPDRNEKAIAKTKLQNVERQIGEMLRPGISPIESWLLDGIQKWIATFMPNRINLRIHPFSDCPAFQVIGNLRREYFVDQDPEQLLYSYGNRPSLPLTIFGLVTAVPSPGPHPFDPMREFETIADVSDKIIFEKIFRSMFNVMTEIEGFVKYSRYPNVTVQPLAVYRGWPIQGR